jgi:CRISPR-associated protein Csb2
MAMAGLSVTVHFVIGRFEGEVQGDPEAASWPPAPARLFAALVAGRPDSEERRALLWLEEQEPPAILAAGDAPRWQVHSFVPTNQLDDKKGGHQEYPGRIALTRRWQRHFPAHNTVVYLWSQAPPPALAGHLLALARRVPYLGRATSPVVVEVATEPPEPKERWLKFRPERARGGGGVELAVPYPGFLDDLDRAFETGEPFDHPETRWYVPDDAVGQVAADAVGVGRGVWGELAIWRFPAGVRLPGELALRVTSALRRAVLHCAPSPTPPCISGHGTDGPHCAYLALPFAGHDYADGHLLGVAVAIPQGHEPEVAPALLKLDHLRVPGLCRLDLERPTTAARTPWALQERRWKGPSREWTTVLPAVLDRHPRRRLTPTEVVQLGCGFAGLPQPLRVEVSKSPLVRGAVALRPHHIRRKPGEQLRLFTHLWVGFERPVEGPVILGAKRHFGLGLCMSVEDG